MINAHALEILDFPRVRQALARHVTSPLGRYKALALVPLEDLGQIQERLDQVEELAAAGRITLSGVRDVLPLVQRARDSQLLQGAELVQILGALEAATELRAKLLPDSDKFPALARLAARIGEHSLLARQMAQQLDSGGAVKDDATPKLRRLRERLAPMRGRIYRALEEAMGRYAAMLQDRLVTVRRDRYVIPIKAEHAGRLGGIVLDASDSGATVYMEPAEVVPLNNELARLKIEEEAEVQRILAELTGRVALEPGLDQTLDALGDYDLVGARWLLAQEWRCSRPQFGAQGYQFKAARHPLIANAVPNTLDLTRNRLLVITGPNMGG
ncbi:MAG: endonuclease MutS2, partial [Deinococcus sp.]|nr:endonuclease MutS2 [Deinococcus sp.]